MGLSRMWKFNKKEIIMKMKRYEPGPVDFETGKTKMISSSDGDFVLYKSIENYEILIQSLLNDLSYLQYVFSHEANYETSIGEKSLQLASKLGFKPNAKTDEELYKEVMEDIPQESLDKMDKILNQIDKNEKRNN